jgi:hypothetical protein
VDGIRLHWHEGYQERDHHWNGALPFQGYEIAPGGEITKFIRIGTETFASKKGTSKFFYHNDHLGGVHVITNITGGGQRGSGP